MYLVFWQPYALRIMYAPRTAAYYALHTPFVRSHSLSQPKLILNTMNNPGVINLSSRVLTPSEISLLGKGLKFCPTPHMPDPGIQRTDLDGLHRSLRLISYFEDNEISNTPAVIVEDSLFYSRTRLSSTRNLHPKDMAGPCRPPGP